MTLTLLYDIQQLNVVGVLSMKNLTVLKPVATISINERFERFFKIQKKKEKQ